MDQSNADLCVPGDPAELAHTTYTSGFRSFLLETPDRSLCCVSVSQNFVFKVSVVALTNGRLGTFSQVPKDYPGMF